MSMNLTLQEEQDELNAQGIELEWQNVPSAISFEVWVCRELVAARAHLATLAQHGLEAEERTAQALQQRDEAREVTAVYAANSIDYSARLAILTAELERTRAELEQARIDNG